MFKQVKLNDAILKFYQRSQPIAFSNAETLYDDLVLLRDQILMYGDLSEAQTNYLNNFIDKFDTTLSTTVRDIFEKWLDDGFLVDFIRELINEEVVESRDGEARLNLRLNRDKQELTTQLDRNTKKIDSHVYVVDFYKLSDPDWTNAINQAISEAVHGQTIIFPSTTIRTKTISINKSLVLDGNKCTIECTDSDRLFTVTGNTDLEFLEIKNFIPKFPNLTGAVNVYFFNCTNSRIKNLEIHHNELGYCRVVVDTAQHQTTTVPNIHHNVWRNDSTVYSEESLLTLYLSTVVNKKFGGWVKNNIFDVYCLTGNNIDLIKFSGGTSSLTFSENYVKNNNLASDAEIDTYTGAEKLKFMNNTLINVSVKRQQMDGSGGVTNENSYDILSGNTLVFENGATQIWGFLLKGSLFTATFNQIISLNKARQLRAFYLQSSNAIYDEFNTHNPTRFNISFNTVDLREGHQDSGFIYYSVSEQENEETDTFASIVGNQVIGGQRFAFGLMMKSISVVSNMWSSLNTNAVTSSMSFGNPQLVVGNIIEGVKNVNNVPLYQSGTFTPQLAFGGNTSDITYGKQSGRYTRLGNIVYLNIQIELTSLGLNTGSATITGLPFTVDRESVLNISRLENFTFTEEFGSIVYGGLSGGGSEIQVRRTRNDNTATSMSNTYFKDNTKIYIDGSYFIRD